MGEWEMWAFTHRLTIPLHPGLHPEEAPMGPEDPKKFSDSYGNIDTLGVRSCQRAANSPGQGSSGVSRGVREALADRASWP